MPYMKDSDGNIYLLNVLQAVVRENAQGWTQMTEDEVKEHFAKTDKIREQFAKINPPTKNNKPTEYTTTSRQLADANQILLYDAAISNGSATHHHNSDSSHHSSHHHNHESSSHHSHSSHSYDHSSGSHDCGSSDSGSGDAGF